MNREKQLEKNIEERKAEIAQESEKSRKLMGESRAKEKKDEFLHKNDSAGKQIYPQKKGK